MGIKLQRMKRKCIKISVIAHVESAFAARANLQAWSLGSSAQRNCEPAGDENVRRDERTPHTLGQVHGWVGVYARESSNTSVHRNREGREKMSYRNWSRAAVPERQRLSCWGLGAGGRWECDRGEGARWTTGEEEQPAFPTVGGLEVRHYIIHRRREPRWV